MTLVNLVLYCLSMLNYIQFIVAGIISSVCAETNDAFVNAGRPSAAPQTSLVQLQDFVNFGIKFMLTLLLICGIAMLMGALVQYLEHRKNPMNPPLSRVMTFLGIGIVLVGASFLQPAGIGA